MGQGVYVVVNATPRLANSAMFAIGVPMPPQASSMNGVIWLAMTNRMFGVSCVRVSQFSGSSLEAVRRMRPKQQT